MPNWKKVIVSGSDATLTSVTATVGLVITGSAIITGSLGVTGSFNQAFASLASGLFAYAQGLTVSASGDYSHAEGAETTANGQSSHAEGISTTTNGFYSHAEGVYTTTIGLASHAEGFATVASGAYSHAEGGNTITSGRYSHAEGSSSIAAGTGSHAEGFNTVALGSYQHVQGQYNISSSAQSAFIVGNGTGTGALRSNLIFASGSQVQVTGSVIATAGFTGSLQGTATTASYVLNAVSSSFATTASNATTASYVVNTATGANSVDLVYGNMADNDQFRIRVGGTATNAGFAEIATADDGTEPIHVRQYSGVFSSLVRTATLLDGSGNSSFPGGVTAAAGLTITGSARITGSLRVTGSLDLVYSGIGGGISVTGHFPRLLLINSGSGALGAGGAVTSRDDNFATKSANADVFSVGAVDAGSSFVGRILFTKASSNSTNVSFYNSGAEGAFYISGSGNIGIGKTTPGAKLDVNGSAIISGSLQVTGGITGSLFGTASYTIATATNATSASYATVAQNVLNESSFALLGSPNVFTDNQTIEHSLQNGDGISAKGQYSHAEGSATTAIGTYSHAEGEGTAAIGQSSHTEGYGTRAATNIAYSSAISSGSVTIDGYGDLSTSFSGDEYLVIWDAVFDNLYGTIVRQIDSVSYDGLTDTNTITLYDTTITTTEANVGNITQGVANWTGDQTIPADWSHAEGYLTATLGNYSHAEGHITTAIGDYSHAEGHTTKAIGYASHAEGRDTIATGSYSHAEGISSIAQGSYSHAEGSSTATTGDYSHAEGSGTQAAGQYSHVEGAYASATINAIAAHAEGLYTIADGAFQHVQGQYNISSSAQSAFIHGNGTADGARSNLIFASGSQVQVTGSLIVSGSSTITGTQTISGSLIFATPTSPAFNGEIVRFGSGTLTTGQLYFLSSSGTWSLANANSTGSSTGMLGIATGTSPTTAGLLVRGYAASSSYTTATGSIVYAATSSGLMTTTSPSSSNHVVRVVGYVTTIPNTIYFAPDPTFVTLA